MVFNSGKITSLLHSQFHNGKYSFKPLIFYFQVTKPFEMSDFYKYSTKFRKQMHPPPPTSLSVTLSPDGAPQSPQSPQQQKGVYTPLQPLTCQPLEPQCGM